MIGCTSRSYIRPAPQPQDRSRENSGSSAVRRAISNEAVRCSVVKFGKRLEGIILTGSVARDEGTVLGNGARKTVLGDAEFVLVFRDRGNLPSSVELHELQSEIELNLHGFGFTCSISLDSVHSSYLCKLQPHIYAYELRTCGRVVWGNERLLGKIPVFSPSQIPLEDAWRLLCNRMIEQLECVHDLSSETIHLSTSLQYSTVKLYLDMATSFLLFAGLYEPAYSDRERQLRALAEEGGDKDVPFNLAEFSSRVTQCTQWKLAGLDENFGLGRDFWEGAVSHARRLWLWEIARLTRANDGSGSVSLWVKLAHKQSVLEKLRGWLFIVRRQQWHKSWRSWPRWAKLGLCATPRYYIYRMAFEIFSCLPDLVGSDTGGARGDRDWNELRTLLPDCEPYVNHGQIGWRQLTSDIVRNYHQFLTETRS
jgi:hypothetical protein